MQNEQQKLILHQVISTLTPPLHENWANEDSWEKITASQKSSERNPMLSWWMISLAHLYLLAMLAAERSGLLLYLYSQVFLWSWRDGVLHSAILWVRLHEQRSACVTVVLLQRYKGLCFRPKDWYSFFLLFWFQCTSLYIPQKEKQQQEN